MNILGLGTAGCKIAKKLDNYSQYNAFFIDVRNDGEYKNFFKIEEQSTHEDYESNYKPINLQDIVGETTLVTAGSGKITGLLLRLMEQLKNDKLTVLYIKPDMSTASEDAILREKVVFGILQQYVRSSLLSRLYIISNIATEAVLEKVSVVNYWDDINDVISSTFHMLNVFENTEPLLSTFTDVKKTNQIATLGVVGYKNLDEKIFYDLQKPRLKKYFFGISEKTLNEEKDLLQKIRSYVKDKSEERCSACFAIYSTNYEQDYVYVAQYASLIQEQNLDS
jgi:hypothetical protein|tara:strand:- start:837 stop:1676 length:840 start_codon:yes stop_codon:yes gene_type:complete